MTSSEIDIKEISSLIDDIEAGRMSRNKNYFTLIEFKAFRRFKRAKLLMSVIDDLNRTAAVTGNKIEYKMGERLVEIKLFNPILKYRRKVTITEAELNLIKSKTGLT